MRSLVIMLFIGLGPAQALAATQPTVGIVQAAYEREVDRGDPRHDKNLSIVAIDCSSGKIEHEYLCWVTFISKIDETQTLYYDVAALAQNRNDWSLQSGLCRR